MHLNSENTLVNNWSVGMFTNILFSHHIHYTHQNNSLVNIKNKHVHTLKIV